MASAENCSMFWGGEKGEFLIVRFQEEPGKREKDHKGSRERGSKKKERGSIQLWSPGRIEKRGMSCSTL